MCGLLLISNKKNIKSQNVYYIKKGLIDLKRRGPDSDFSYTDEKIGLGQTVLSFSRAEHRKLEHFSPSNRYTVLLNGEIYNWKLIANKYIANKKIISDIHLIANLVDNEKPIESYDYRGMFVIIIYDKHLETVKIISDKLSEKSCYYYIDSEKFVLSSELGPIVDLLKPSINSEMAKEYFYSRHYSPLNKTIYNNIYKTVPDQLIIFSRVNWSLKDKKRNSLDLLFDADYKKYLETLGEEEIYTEAVKVYNNAASEISNSAINPSVIVSGGVDSSTASKFLRNHNSNITSVALSFTNKDQQAHAFKAKTNNQIDILDVTEDDYYRALIRSYEITRQPLPTHSFASQLIISEYVKGWSKTLFTGDIGDELFGGYEAYENIKYNNKINQYSNSPYSIVTGECFTRSKERWEYCNSKFAMDPDNERILSATLLNDLLTNGTAVGLLCSDLATSSVGVESRAFYANENILKFAFNMPVHLKMPVPRKSIKNRIFANHFFKEIFSIPPFEKQGFSGYPDVGFLFFENSTKDITNLLMSNIGLVVDKNKLISDRVYRWKCVNLSLFFVLNEIFY